MTRIVVPSWFQAQATAIDWAVIERKFGKNATADTAQSVVDAPSRQSYQLRWMLAALFGLPRAPFRVFLLNANLSLTSFPNLTATLDGSMHKALFPKPMARVVLDVNLSKPGAVAYGISADKKIVGFASVTGTGEHVLAMDSSAISYVLVAGTGDLKTVRAMEANDLANNVGWKEVEQVGLPISAASAFTGTGYDTTSQGLLTGPVSPNAAALRRLAAGAPLVGWSPVLPSGVAAPAWVGAAPQPFLNELQATLLPKLVQMMQKSGAPQEDATATLEESIAVQAPGSQPSTQESKATYSPLHLLLMAASSDPFNALGLGFGTAYTLDELTKLIPAAQTPAALTGPAVPAGWTPPVPFKGAMVTCDVILDLSLFGGASIPLTLASIVLSNEQIEVLPTVEGLAATTSGNYPPQQLDQPWRESILLHWNRPQTVIPVQSSVASYTVARRLPEGLPVLLNKPRVSGGVKPYIPALPSKAAPDADLEYNDIEAPEATPNAMITYFIAAQDWFGVWSPWASAGVALQAEPLQTPVLSDPTWKLAPGTNPFQATLTVQVAWDWTTRSPKQFDLLVSLIRPEDATSPLPTGPLPTGVQHSVGGSAGTPVSLTFTAQQQPQASGGASVILVPAPSYNVKGHDVRVYQVTIPGFSLDFAGRNEIVAQIWARGQSNLNPVFSATDKPLNVRALSPVPPLTPSLDSMVWATLPDPLGVRRVHLKWPNSEGAAGYFIYEATETRMIAVAEDGGWISPKPPPGKPIVPVPDLTGLYADRLKLLRSLDWSKMRKAFTRLNSTALQVAEMEVALPRGSRVIHAFVVTAVSANNIESPFPTSSAAFAAVAAPFVQTAQPPRIAARADPASGTITMTLEQRGAITPAWYDILSTHRDDLATDAGLMGPPLKLTGTTTTVPGPTPASPPTSIITTFKHTGVTSSWKRLWYRAVGVTVDNLTNPSPSGTTPPWGALGGRAQSSEAVWTVLPPPTAPQSPVITQQNLVGSGNVLVLFHVAAPAATTPLGSFILKILQENNAPGLPNPQPLYLPLESPAFTISLPPVGSIGQLFRMAEGDQTIIGLRLAATTTTTVTATVTDPLGRASASAYLALK